ncbi:MAG: hypothetical protein HC930_15550 [Hydrococcus sp. SU_1_0]|nr:hypothetical protein [Hydrococcus sp. SU_1_0]
MNKMMYLFSQIKKSKNKLSDQFSLPKRIYKIQANLAKMQEALGRIESRQIQSLSDKLTDKLFSRSIQNNEFQVFSQWGEDGIIQALISEIEIERKIFVEFGVQDYTEANTRFLLVNNNWSGLVMDSSPEYIQYIKQDRIYWRYNLKAECAFIDKDNINELLINNGITGDIGLLSIDVDGNDYWIWEAIHCISPRIVISEYNGLFGNHRKLLFLTINSLRGIKLTFPIFIMELPLQLCIT